MGKTYRIETPQQMRMLAEICIDPGIEGKQLRQLSTVWNADRNKNGGTSRWDTVFSVNIDTTGKPRMATVQMKRNNKTDATQARLKYQAAAAWCRENLIQGL